MLTVGRIGEAYARRQDDTEAADYIARYMAGLLLWLDLPSDLRELAGGPNLTDPKNDPPP